MAKRDSNQPRRGGKIPEHVVGREWIDAIVQFVESHLAGQSLVGQGSTVLTDQFIETLVSAAQTRAEALAALEAIVVQLPPGYPARAGTEQLLSLLKEQDALDASTPLDLIADGPPPEHWDASSISEVSRMIGKVEARIERSEAKSKGGTDGTEERDDVLLNREVEEALLHFVPNPAQPKRLSADLLAFLRAKHSRTLWPKVLQKETDDRKFRAKPWIRARFNAAKRDSTC